MSLEGTAEDGGALSTAEACLRTAATNLNTLHIWVEGGVEVTAVRKRRANGSAGVDCEALRRVGLDSINWSHQN